MAEKFHQLSFEDVYPAWVWVERNLGGIREILKTWQDGAMYRHSPAPREEILELLGAGPSATETEALDNIEQQAKKFVAAKGRRGLTPLQIEVVAWDRFYLANYERRQFGLMYAVFVDKLTGRDERTYGVNNHLAAAIDSGPPEFDR